MTVWTEMAGGTGDPAPAEAFTSAGCQSEEIIQYQQYNNTMNGGAGGALNMAKILANIKYT